QQGRSMEEDGVTIGLVNATWGARKLEFKITGEQSHSGATLMQDRNDALVAASRLIVTARELAEEFKPGTLHTACGEIHVYPNSPVVVASDVRLLLDLRSPDAEVLKDAYVRIIETVGQVQVKDGVEIKIVSEHNWEQNPYPEEGLELAREVAEELGLSHDRIMTVAGHDSTNMKEITPTVMLFVPSVKGISHNVDEFTTEEDLLAGLEHLTEVV